MGNWSPGRGQLWICPAVSACEPGYLRAIRLALSRRRLPASLLPLCLRGPAPVSMPSAPGPALGWRVIWFQLRPWSPRAARLWAVRSPLWAGEGMIRGSLQRHGLGVAAGSCATAWVWGVVGHRLTATAFLIGCVSGFPGLSLQLPKAPPPIPPGSRPPASPSPPRAAPTPPTESFTAGGGSSPALQLRGQAGRPAMGARTLGWRRCHPRLAPSPTLIIKTIPGREELRSLARQREVAAVHRGSEYGRRRRQQKFRFS